MGIVANALFGHESNEVAILIATFKKSPDSSGITGN
jgi:hypothetical protein